MKRRTWLLLGVVEKVFLVGMGKTRPEASGRVQTGHGQQNRQDHEKKEKGEE